MPVSSPAFAAGFSSSSRPSRSASCAAPPMHTASEVFMERSAGKRHQSCGKAPPKLRDIDSQVWCRMFRRFHPVKTADGVAADLGASPRTVENWMSGVSAPSLIWFVRILACYGPDVLAEFLPGSCGWLAVALRAQELAALEARHAALAAEIHLLRSAA